MDQKYLFGRLLCADGVNNLNRVVRLADGSLFTLGCISRDVHHINQSPKSQFIFYRKSHDGGKTWELPTFLFEIPEKKAHAGLLEFMFSRTGALHVFMERIKVYDWKNNDFQGDILYARMDGIHDSSARISKIECLDRYTGSMNNLIELENGRLVVPLSTLRPGKPSFVSNTLYSDDDGLTWQASNDVEVISEETHCESGAVEPVVIETAAGRLVMIIRTVLGCFYYATSADGGQTWSQAARSRIKSSNAPAVLEKLPDGRILMAWNNCNGAPMQGVRYSFARQCLHAAISDDGMKTLTGCRMIVKKIHGDPDDVKNCYPLASIAGPDAVYLRFFAVGSRDGDDWSEPAGKLLELPVQELTASEWTDDFSQGSKYWVTNAWPLEPAKDDQRPMLTIAASDGQAGYAMSNFPFGTAGALTLAVHTAPSSYGVSIILADNYLDQASFRNLQENDPYRPFIEENYLEIPLTPTGEAGSLKVAPDADCVLSFVWDHQSLTASCGEFSITMPIPQNMAGFNHVGAVVHNQGQSFAIQRLTARVSKPGLPTGITV